MRRKYDEKDGSLGIGSAVSVGHCSYDAVHDVGKHIIQYITQKKSLKVITMHLRPF